MDEVTGRRRIEVAALKKGLGLLRHINRLNGATARELSTTININRSTTHRLVETLVASGVVKLDPYDGKYRATRRARRLSMTDQRSDWIDEIAKPRLEVLGRAILWPVALTTLGEDGLVSVRSVTDHASPFAAHRIPAGSRLSLLGTASGRVFLACAAPDRRKRWIARSLMSMSQLRLEGQERLIALAADEAEIAEILQQVREDGFAVATFADPDVSAVAVPVIAEGSTIAALTVRWRTRSVSWERATAEFLPLLRAAADDIATAMAASRPSGTSRRPRL